MKWLDFVKQKAKSMPGKALGEVLPIASKEWKRMKASGSVPTVASSYRKTKSQRSSRKSRNTRKSKSGSRKTRSSR